MKSKIKDKKDFNTLKPESSQNGGIDIGKMKEYEYISIIRIQKEEKKVSIFFNILLIALCTFLIYTFYNQIFLSFTMSKIPKSDREIIKDWAFVYTDKSVFLNYDDKVAGLTFKTNKTIYIKFPSTRVILHEIGHALDDEMEYTKEEEWKNIYETEGTNWSSEREYFADAYAYYYSAYDDYKDTMSLAFKYIEKIHE